MSPAKITAGKEKLNLGVKRIPFGVYAMVYTQTSNSIKSRSVPSVAFNPSYNDGGQFFISLYTEKRCTCTYGNSFL